jgi:hypothetical protein
MRKRRMFGHGIWLLALALDHGRAESLMKFDSLTYTVAEMMGPPQKLTIQANGEARYESHSNNSTPDTPEIGFYEMILPPPVMEVLERDLDNPPFEKLADHSGRIASGDRAKRISVVSGSHTIQKMAGTTEPVDPGLERLLSRLDRVTVELMKHPKQVLRMEVSDVALDDSGMLTLDFVLSNGGSETVKCANPLLPTGGPGLSIRGWPDKQAPLSSVGEPFGISTVKATELGTPHGEARTETVVAIDAGKQIAFHASARLAAPGPQTYLVQLAYQNTTEIPGGAPVMIGELFSKIVKLQVRAPKGQKR